MPSFVQNNSNFNTTSAVTSITVTCTAVGSGHLVCGFICGTDASQTCTVKDNNGVSATMVPNSSGVNDTNGNRSWMYYAPNVSGAPTSYVATFSASTGTVVAITLQEWSGIATTSPLDQSNISNVASAATVTGTSVTTTQANELCFSGVIADTNSPGTISAGTNFAWTIRNNSSAGGGADESFVQSSAGSVAGQFKFSTAAGCQLGIMTFKPSAAAQNPFIPNPSQYDLPLADYSRNWYQHWQTRFQQTRPVNWNQFDWPNPRGNPRPDEFYSFDNVQFLVRQPASFFHNYDFPNPYPIQWYRSWEFNNVQFLVREPASRFKQYDWPNPQPVTWYQWWFQTPLQHPQTLPFNQMDWPNPQPIQWYRSWELGHAAIYSVTQIPFVQSDWPLPIAPIYWDRFWSQSPGQPTPTAVLSEWNWNLPQPITWYQDYNQNLVIRIPTQAPFIQTDWPNPQPLTWYRDYNQNLVIYLPTSAQPFNQYDWPVPKTPQPIDQFYFQALVPLLPPPPPPPTQVISGRTWTREEWTKKLTEYTRIKQNLSLLGKYAAQARWSKR